MPPPRKMQPVDLVRAVVELQSEQPVVTSEMVREWCGQHEIDWGAATAGFIGRDFYKADHSITGDGVLTKWKSSKLVGWSLSEDTNPDAFARASEWADNNGWYRAD